jgi:chromosome segregation ATPase
MSSSVSVVLCLCLRAVQEGNDMDEFEAHRFLEQLGETLTVQAMRNKFRELDVDFNKRMAFVEYLIYKYGKSVRDVVNAKQGGDPKELEKAQRMVDDAQAAFDSLTKRLEEEKAALAAANKAETEAKSAEAAAKSAEASAASAENAARAAEAEQKAALDELKRQEDAIAAQLASLSAKINDSALGTVAKGKAKQEYEQLKGQDPLPLQRAKINQGATVRKFETARKFAEDERNKATAAREKAENERKDAEQKRAAAESSAAAVAAAVADAEQKFQAAMAFLEEEKSKPSASHGDIWWMQREMEEKKKYMPLSKGGVARK